MKTSIKILDITVFAAMLLLSIVFVPAASAQTNENMGINDECDNFSIEKEYGELFLERMGYSINLTSPKPLKNLDNDIEAVAFSISNEGYIIEPIPKAILY